LIHSWLGFTQLIISQLATGQLLHQQQQRIPQQRDSRGSAFQFQ
jgi:hypothetical protein